MAYETEIENIENYYADLLIIQYRNKPKARATIKLGVDLYLADGLVFQMQDVLDIDTAVGAQLDLIGKILGQEREIHGLTLDKDYFSFEKVDAFGYSDKDELSDGYWKQYRNSIASEYSLQDDDYRILLKFKALYNIRLGNMKFMDGMLYRLFGTDITITNNKDLTITYNIPTNYSTAVTAIIFLGYFNAPLGIDYNINYI